MTWRPFQVHCVRAARRLTQLLVSHLLPTPGISSAGTEQHCGKQAADRQVILTRDGAPGDIARLLESADLYKSASLSQSRFTCIYDTENARLRSPTHSETACPVQRGPVMSDKDFDRPCGAMYHSAKPCECVY